MGKVCSIAILLASISILFLINYNFPLHNCTCTCTVNSNVHTSHRNLYCSMFISSNPCIKQNCTFIHIA